MVNLPRLKYSHTILYLSFISTKIYLSIELAFAKTYWGHTVQLLGSLSNDDGDGNDNGKKAIGL